MHFVTPNHYAQMVCSNFSFPASTTDEEKIIWAYTRGFSQRVIQKSFHIGSIKVNRTIQYYKKNKEIPKPKNTTAKKLTENILLYIETTLINEAHTTLQEMQNQIKSKFQMAISLATLSRGCKKLNFSYKPPKHCQLLTQTQKTNRVSFAITLIDMFYSNNIDLTSIIFSDESRFVLGDDKRWVWRRHGTYSTSVFSKSEKFPPSVMIYGAIGHNYKSKLVICEGSINSDVYKQNILKSGMIDELNEKKGKGNWIFQQDGARCHTSKDSVA